uniref:hypothetical protein n=1 Tax=Candidatus Tripitaka californicus TaxID=3367616 RepID=UPI00402859B5
MDKCKKRAYISFFFRDSISNNRKRGYLTVAFNSDDAIYAKCKKLGTSKIKKIIGIDSYKDLVEKAKKENRTLGNYIKYRLIKKLS